MTMTIYSNNTSDIEANQKNEITLLNQIASSLMDVTGLVRDILVIVPGFGFTKRYILNSLASVNANSIENTTVIIGTIIASNNGLTNAYLKLYNTNTVPDVGVDTPANIIMIPIGQTVVINLSCGFSYSNGLGIGITGGSPDASDTTPVSSDQVTVNIMYN